MFFLKNSKIFLLAISLSFISVAMEAKSESNTSDLTNQTSAPSLTSSTPTQLTEGTNLSATDLSSSNMEIKIALPSSGFIASKGFEIAILGRNTDNVSVFLKGKNDGTILNLGSALKVGEDKWKLSVPAAVLKNGEFILEAVSIYQNKEYKSDSIAISVKLPNSSVTVNGDTLNLEKDISSFVKLIRPISGANITSEELTVEIRASNAVLVEVFVREKNSTVKKYVTRASKLGADLWGTKIQVKTRIPNGEYHLIAKMKDSAGNFKESAIPIRIALINTTTNSESIGANVKMNSPTQTVPPIKPETLDPDGEEIKNDFNPLKYEPEDKSDKIILESPRETGQFNPNYVVESVVLEKKSEQDSVLKFKGKALPNSFVTIYIFSEPIVITVKTDANGDWTYELDKQLEDGQHEVYVAVTDNTGKITSKSEPLMFIKTAEAATVISSAQAQEMNKNKSPAQKSKESFVWIAFLLVVIFLGISLAVVGIINHKNTV